MSWSTDASQRSLSSAPPRAGEALGSSDHSRIRSNLADIARQIYGETLCRLALPEVMRRKVQLVASHVHIGSLSYELGKYRKIQIVAVGKAAKPMVETLLAILEPGLRRDQGVEGVIVTAGELAEGESRLRWFQGSHPLPDENSFASARCALQLLQEADADTLAFFLISGGASAMMELPWLEEVSLAEMRQFYQALVRSGLSIAEMNALRKHVSRVKGGRLAIAAPDATHCTLLVSDVPSHVSRDVVGSGLSLPDPTTLEECRDLLRTKLANVGMPETIQDAFALGELPETPKATHRAFDRSSTFTLLSSDDLCETAQVVAQELGFRTVVDLACDEWNYQEAASHLLGTLRSMSHEDRPVCVISAGELSVPISGDAGTGGRNQQFALECARQIAGSSEAIAILSAGSDGVDGNSRAAGAVVDPGTVGRALAQGLSADHALARFDSFPLHQAAGGLIVTGPTGNNVRDLRLLLWVPKG